MQFFKLPENSFRCENFDLKDNFKFVKGKVSIVD